MRKAQTDMREQKAENIKGEFTYFPITNCILLD